MIRQDYDGYARLVCSTEVHRRLKGQAGRRSLTLFELVEGALQSALARLEAESEREVAEQVAGARLIDGPDGQ